MGKYKFKIFLIVSALGFVLFYWLWPEQDKLPVLAEVSNFQLNEVNGDVYQLHNEKVKLIAFFYTNCPNICPMTMLDFKDLQAELKAHGLFGEEAELVSISIDPENDSTKNIKEYAAAFQADHGGWKWLRGTPEQTKQIAEEFQMQYQKLEGDFYSHSITMYLVDRDNRIRGLYDMAIPNKSINKEDILGDIMYLSNDH